MMNNKYWLLKEKPKANILIWIILVFLLFLFLSACHYKVFDVHHYQALSIENNVLSFYIPTKDLANITKAQLKIAEKTYQYQIKSLQKIHYVNSNYQQEVQIILTENIPKNAIVELKFFNNKEKIIKKIIKLIS